MSAHPNLVPQPQLIVRHLGMVDYQTAWQAMQQFTDHRDSTVCDELWLLQHPPVFTQGQAGKAEHILAPGDIPVIQVDRGGQVTYHGPGQLVGYLLIDLKRLKIGVRDLVTSIENTIIKLLAHYYIDANQCADAPGVYLNEEGVTGAKIAQLGLRVRRGCSFHGLSLNVEMEMEPFSRINPCGYAGMQVTSMAEQLAVTPSMKEVSNLLLELLRDDLGYGECLAFTDGVVPAVSGG